MESLFSQEFLNKLPHVTVADPARWLLENKVRTYNQEIGEDDGTGIHCARCKDKGWEAYIPEGEQRMVIRPCRCGKRRRVALRLRECGLLEAARRCTLESFEAKSPFQAAMKGLAEDFLRQPEPGWLALCGQSGAGKTHLCTAVFVRLVADRDLDGDYMLWGPALRRIKTELWQGSDSLLERYKQVELLYVDDLFKAEAAAPLKDQDLRLSFELLDYRYSRRLPTILSTERTLGQLLALDEAIASRIRERCGKYILNIEPGPGRNYRAKPR